MISVVAVAVLLLIGVALRAGVPIVERARIPASVVAGIVGCLLAQLLLASTDRFDASLGSILATFRSWSGPLISIVFAGLLLAPSGQTLQRSREVWQQGIAAWIIILGQLALGLIVTALLIAPFYDVPAPFGQYIEVTMAGGFGSANSMGAILASPSYQFPQGRDLLVFGATAGLLWGVVSGLVLARIGQLRRWTSAESPGFADPNPTSGAVAGRAAPPASTSLTASKIHLEPLLLQLCFLLIAMGLGIAMQTGVSMLAGALDAQFDPVQQRYAQNLGNLPLFFFALLGGWIVRIALRSVRLDGALDRELIHRLCSIAMDVLIVTSLAAIAFNQVRAYVWPVLLLLAVGSAWSVFCLVWLSPRVLPRRYWFELGLINYGFSTAATAQGMMFLKLVDPKLRSGAAETYALGAPLTAPFIGGGVLTFAVLPPLIGAVGSIPVAAGSIAILVALYLLGRRLQRSA